MAALPAVKEAGDRRLLIERLQAYQIAHPEHKSAVQILVACNQGFWVSDTMCGKDLFAAEGDKSLEILTQMGAEGVFGPLDKEENK